jgi:membrane associated rhomboid family serine protease
MIPLRDENPTERTPIVTILIMIACTLVYFFEMSLPEPQLNAFLTAYGVVPARYFAAGAAGSSAFFPLISYMFLHGGFLHYAGNMLYLWIFGNNVEDRLGHVGFLIFYTICGIAAALIQSAATATSTAPLIGASGAIAGVLAAYLVLFPNARIVSLVFFFFFITTVALPASVVILLWFLLQLASSFQTLAGVSTGVAYLAHVGGFVVGLVLVFLFPKKRKPPRVLPPDYFAGL